MIIQTERLLLRPMQAGDAQDFYEYAKNPNVGPNAGWKPHESIEETKGLLEELFIGSRSSWGITLKENRKLIGSIGLVDDAKRMNKGCRMLGYSIGEHHWGRGITTEAARAVIRYGFEQMGLSIISVYVYPFNERSKRVIEKCGFQYEGRLRAAEEIYSGNIYDNICYSITLDEYKKLSHTP
ncbi:GNAT family N-acetyltransferase [Clostridia bacterium OttesenSCG-928-F22]|nr:GNAT family N-acetyltransferase [Clostridia bacterium OttesenSCG-928-F22]